MRRMSDPDYVYTPWSAERKAAASQRAKDRIRAKKYDTEHPFPDKDAYSREEAPAAAWVQCLMEELRKDAADIAEGGEWLWVDAALVLLVIGLRGKMDVPFIRAVTGLAYHDILVMCVRLKLGGIVREDDTPVMEAITNEKDPAMEQVQTSMNLGLMLGMFRRSVDDLWQCGDHTDLDANAAQHLLQDIRHAA
jgi:hypothetical protein